MKDINLVLVTSEWKIVLEALTEMEKKMSDICDSSDNPDEVADIGNDLIELRLLLKRLQETAISHYGDNILNFSREPF